MTMVLILPMRNGNAVVAKAITIDSSGSYPTYEEWKQITFCHKYNIIIFRSYPTYEEWKPQKFFYNQELSNRSYPTYEEWKLTMVNKLELELASSYPTYEEWKQ